MTRPRIALADYGMGNLHSVGKALERVGAGVDVIRQAVGMGCYVGLVVPGVGNFGDGVRQLRERGLLELAREWIATGRLFLGICVGMQLLMEESEEAPGVKGLGVYKGRVKRFAPADSSLKVPQMGWNQVAQRPGCPLFTGIPDNSYFYFVHSYYVAPEDVSVVGGETEFGIRYCSFIWRDNVFASQFHPEKSQVVGLRMLENFVNLAQRRARGEK